MRFVVNSTKLLLLASAVSLAACGSGGDGDTGSLTGLPQEGGSNGGGTGGGNGGATAPQLALGANSADSFQSGALTLSSSTLSAGGQATVTAHVVNQAASNALYVAEAISVNFTSNCAAQGTATITSPVNTGQTGIAQAVYKANGCTGSDTITATIANGGATASANIIVASADTGSLSFSTATPSTIALKNLGSAGLATVSEVQFIVRDETGNPLRGETINFSLSDETGGVALTNTSDTTDANGVARAFVNAGTVKTTVRVNAALASDPSLKTTSSTIAIGTGVPTQRSLSLAASTYNMPACQTEGYENEITVRVSDYYLNPIADGTKIIFYTSHGQIEPECTYGEIAGGCKVTWRSQEPYPLNADEQGIVAVMATLKGEEATPTDSNGDHLFDINDSYTSIGEAYVDNNADDQFTPGEEFIDWDENGDYSANPAEVKYGTSKFRGVRCTADARAAGHCQGLADLYKNLHLSFSCDVKQVHLTTDDACTTNTGTSAVTTGTTSTELKLCFKDAYGNAPSAGSKITITAASGTGTIVGGDVEITVPNNILGPYVVPVKIRPGTAPSTTELDVSVENAESKLKTPEILTINHTP